MLTSSSVISVIACVCAILITRLFVRLSIHAENVMWMNVLETITLTMDVFDVLTIGEMKRRIVHDYCAAEKANRATID